MNKTLILILITNLVFAQNLKTKYNWHNLDMAEDSIRGMSTEKTYRELLNGKLSQTVIVGVIDSGVDVNHEDLKDIIWANSKEIAGNNLDDDKNGFVDDRLGWDFIGGANGKVINQEQLEIVREYLILKQKFGDKPKNKFIKKHRADYDKMNNLKADIDKETTEAQNNLPMYEKMLESVKMVEMILSLTTGKPELTVADVSAIKDEDVDRKVRAAKQYWLNLRSMGANKTDIEEGVEHFKNKLNYNLNLNFLPRASIVGDDLSKLQYSNYGNNDEIGPDPLHGTHVAGIIAGNRKNGKGIMGVADNVKILVVRCVPDGDERDKDVANAIRYAVDNGAQIINMSFGKSLSPQKHWVDEAVKYAESKGVLLVSAAGNESENVDEKEHYPNRILSDGTEAKNWIVVGAQNFDEGNKLVADFSNYGKKGVDVFAPGTAIYSSVPGSKYEEKQGTSMASPAVAGVAALLKSYFPTLTAVQIKKIIMDSSIKMDGIKVLKPGTKDEVDFSELSQTGGIVNTYNAVKMAQELTK